jgi:hypothetical protein
MISKRCKVFEATIPKAELYFVNQEIFAKGELFAKCQ